MSMKVKVNNIGDIGDLLELFHVSHDNLNILCLAIKPAPKAGWIVDVTGVTLKELWGLTTLSFPQDNPEVLDFCTLVQQLKQKSILGAQVNYISQGDKMPMETALALDKIPCGCKMGKTNLFEGDPGQCRCYEKDGTKEEKKEVGKKEEKNEGDAAPDWQYHSEERNMAQRFNLQEGKVHDYSQLDIVTPKEGDLEPGDKPNEVIGPNTKL